MEVTKLGDYVNSGPLFLWVTGFNGLIKSTILPWSQKKKFCRQKLSNLETQQQLILEQKTQQPGEAIQLKQIGLRIFLDPL